MADGNIFEPNLHVCAMRYEPLGERVRIVNSDNGREASCRIEDRGPWISGRIIDVSPIVRDELGFTGLANVRVYRIVR